MRYLSQQWPAIVQAASALIVVYLTYRLVLATDLYARLTRASLALSSKQFEQELLPNWHISFAPSEEGLAWLRIFNLSRNSARVTHLFIRVESENEPEVRRFPLDLGMPSGHRETTDDVSAHILEAVRPYTVNGDWNGTLEIGVVFQLAGSPEPRPSTRFLFSGRTPWWQGVDILVKDARSAATLCSTLRFKKRQRVAFLGPYHQKPLKLVRTKIFSTGVTKIAVLKNAI